jgi:hypothetical protein
VIQKEETGKMHSEQYGPEENPWPLLTLSQGHHQGKRCDWPRDGGVQKDCRKEG